MSDIAVRVEGLGKQFVLRGKQEKYRTLRDTIAHAAGAPVRMARGLFSRNGSRPEPENTFWALKDINFEVKRGEVVGIIGRNGAGKSTLLKILSRITEPTEGCAEIYGRVGSLLEVGTGFHPELSGRENIFLNGAILGMRRREIERQFDEIVAFAEVEKFIDMPVKHYSSGMYLRLAFAVAAHLEPEILIVDEVLAVGDAAFQKKCMGKMQDVAGQGRTVLFVSHNMAAIQQLTSKAILLNKGFIESWGITSEVVNHYLSLDTQFQWGGVDVEFAPRRYHDLSQAVQIIYLDIENNPGRLIPSDVSIPLLVRVRANQDVSRFRFGITLFKFDGTPVGSVFCPEVHSICKGVEATYRILLEDMRLAPGQYHWGIATGLGDHRTGHKDYDVILDVLPFEVMSPEGIDGTKAYWTQGWGVIRFKTPVVDRVA